MASKPKKSRGSSCRKGQAKENEADVEANSNAGDSDCERLFSIFLFQNVPVYRTIILINLCF